MSRHKSLLSTTELILTLYRTALWVTFIGGIASIPYVFSFFLDVSRVHQGQLPIRRCVSPRSVETILGLISASARQQFGSLQQRAFPVYFKLNAIVSSGLLVAWTRNHSTVIALLAHPTVPDVCQAYALGVVAIAHTLNIVWFGPVTSKYVMWQL